MNAFLTLPLRYAWTKRNTTGIKPIAIIVLANGAVVIVLSFYYYGEFAVANWVGGGFFSD